MGMKFEQINRKFTQKVFELMSEGYIIHASTMGGHQGEIAKIDLTDGKKVVRVELSTDYSSRVRRDGKAYFFTKVLLTVGVATDKVTINDKNGETIWSKYLDVLSNEEFYQIGRGNWYGTQEESMAQQDKARERYAPKRDTFDLMSPVAARIVIPFVRRQYHCKSATVHDIESIEKRMCVSFDEHEKGPRMRYSVSVRGRKYFLK